MQNLKYSQIIDLSPNYVDTADCRYWKIVAFFAPLLGAMLIAGSLVKDHHHSAYDCIAGGIIGAVIGYAHFRTSYFGVWDYRVNHIPLSRAGFPLAEDEIGCVRHEKELTVRVGRMRMRGTFTYEGGWGDHGRQSDNNDNLGLEGNA
jgi:hypothetical protein